MFGMFRNKTLKALDKIYETYEKLHEDYHKYNNTENEIFRQQALIIRGQLHQTGAAFDHVIAASGPEFLEKCHKEFGYIPFTAKTFINDNAQQEYTKTNTAKLEMLVGKAAVTEKGTSRLQKLLHRKYIKEAITEAATNHLDMIEEARDLKMLGEDRFTTNWTCPAMVNILEEVYQLPKGKQVTQQETSTGVEEYWKDE